MEPPWKNENCCHGVLSCRQLLCLRSSLGSAVNQKLNLLNKLNPMKIVSKSFIGKGLVLAVLPALTCVYAQAALSVSNGDFETGIADESTVATVNGWFSVTTGNFYDNTWQDTRNAAVPTDSQSGFSGQAAAAFSGNAGNNQPSGLNGSWLYQSIGTDATVGSFDVIFDWGDFGDINGNLRDLGMTVSIYESDGSFVAGDNVNINGASGVTLLDSASISLLKTAGPANKLVLNQTVNLNVSSQTGGELFLRFNNWDAGADSPWLMLDNVQIANVAPVPEPSSSILGGLGLAALLVFRRNKSL